MNVSLPPEMERFVRAQVESGRYRSASEVLRDGLRLLEESEQRRLIQKWLFEELTPTEEVQLPQTVRERVQAHFTKLIDEARADLAAGRVTNSSETMNRIQSRLQSRFEREP